MKDKSMCGSNLSRAQVKTWREIQRITMPPMDIGTHPSEEESRLGTPFRNVMKTTTNSAISKSFVDVAKTVKQKQKL